MLTQTIVLYVVWYYFLYHLDLSLFGFMFLLCTWKQR